MSRERNKAILFDYDRIEAQEGLAPTLHCLSATTKMLLLSVVDPIGWTTRYIGDADRVTVERWRTDAMTELILDKCLDELCEMITVAITDCTDVQQALINLAAQQGWSSNTGDVNIMLPLDVRESNMLPDGYQCDNDHRYGMAVGLVEAIHAATLEVFEAFELATNPLELAAEVSDNVPFWQMAATGADIALWVQETMYESYIAAWSDTVKDAISCELWCAMGTYGVCNLSFDTIFDVYIDASFDNVPSVTDNALTWLAWLLALPLTADVGIVKIASLMGLLAMRFGGSFGSFSLGIRTLETTVQLLEDETDTNWDILCDACPELPYEHTWLSGDGTTGIALEPRGPAECEATFEEDEIHGCTTAPGTSVGFAARINPLGTTITRVTMQVSWNKTRAGTEDIKIEVEDTRYDQHDVSVLGTGSHLLDTGEIEENDVTDIYLEGNVRNNSDSDGSYFKVTKITVWGLGSNPWA